MQEEGEQKQPAENPDAAPPDLEGDFGKTDQQNRCTPQEQLAGKVGAGKGGDDEERKNGQLDPGVEAVKEGIPGVKTTEGDVIDKAHTIWSVR